MLAPLMTQLDRRQILAYRYQATGLQAKLSLNEMPRAARQGLQDSSPRSGVIALHCRVDGVEHASWRDRRLTQVWGPRGAVYLIAKQAFGPFTLGLLPRDRERLDTLQTQAKEVLRLLDGRPQKPATILQAMPELDGPRDLLWVSTTGRFLPIWDASTTAMYPAEPADEDTEECRLELARLFLKYLGPATTAGFQWWTGGSHADAAATMAALAPELATVDVEGEEALMLAEDVEAAGAAPPPKGVRVLPPEDPYVNRLAAAVLMPDPSHRKLLYPKAPPPGAVVVNGEVAATWRRRNTKLSITPLPGADLDPWREEVETVAAQIPVEGTDAITTEWLDP